MEFRTGAYQNLATGKLFGNVQLKYNFPESGNRPGTQIERRKKVNAERKRLRHASYGILPSTSPAHVSVRPGGRQHTPLP